MAKQNICLRPPPHSSQRANHLRNFRLRLPLALILALSLSAAAAAAASDPLGQMGRIGEMAQGQLEGSRESLDWSGTGRERAFAAQSKRIGPVQFWFGLISSDQE